MNLANLSVSILATPTGDLPILKAIRDRFSGGPSTQLVLLVMAGLFALGVIIIMASRFLQQAPKPPRPADPELFANIFNVLHLEIADRQLLRKIAHESPLADPSSMLLSPANLALAASPLLKHDRAGDFRKHLDRLCRDLFGEPLPTTSSEPSSRRRK